MKNHNEMLAERQAKNIKGVKALFAKMDSYLNMKKDQREAK